jgi:ribonuclease BN (tRNA processing enzyme)
VEFVDGLLAASAPAMRAGYGIPGETWEANIEVVELGDGESLDVDSMRVRAVENSHFSLPDGSAAARPASSLSYRFDLTDRSIVYTGDTGPSSAVAELARDADLLVSEMIDVDAVLAFMRPPGGQPSNQVDTAPLTGFPWHMHAHHMKPVQVGELANAANVARLVITHYAPNPMGPEQVQRLLDAVRENYRGSAELAGDLGRY